GAVAARRVARRQPAERAVGGGVEGGVAGLAVEAREEEGDAGVARERIVGAGGRGLVVERGGLGVETAGRLVGAEAGTGRRGRRRRGARRARRWAGPRRGHARRRPAAPCPRDRRPRRR